MYRSPARRQPGATGDLRAARRTASERALGSERHDVAVTANNLAAIDDRRGDHAEAERPYRRALAIKERLLGPGHPEVGVTLSNLALALDRRDSTGAIALYAQAIDVLGRALEPGHPTLVVCATNLAAARHGAGPGTTDP